MEIFIGNLPLSTSVLELRRLFGEAGREARFRLFKKACANGSICCYGQAALEPEAAARDVIEQLSAVELCSQRLEVRAYVRRSDPDRRAPASRAGDWRGPERRTRERRQCG